jgi:NRAMP (natural resistance-associated macrophage protein)-like metal ion transporter
MRQPRERTTTEANRADIQKGRSVCEKIAPAASKPNTASAAIAVSTPWRTVAWALGPGIVVMLADADAGNVVTAAQAGAQFRYGLLPLVLALIPMLFMMQELTVRLGIFTGFGHGELVRRRFGAGWASLSLAGLAVAALTSLVTEFSAMAGIGELYGLSRGFSLTAAAMTLLIVLLTGSYRRIEWTALIVGLFEVCFFGVAWIVPLNLRAVAHDAIHPTLDNPEFVYLAAAIIGASFSPWMIFYQQSAIAQKRLAKEVYKIARWETAAGAAFSQLVMAAVLVALAATIGSSRTNESFKDIGQISQILSPVVGETAGRIVFSAGILGAAMVAAIVSLLALVWGTTEIVGWRRARERRFPGISFAGGYAVCIFGAAVLVWSVPDLIWLNISAQFLNAVLLPQAIGFLLALTITELPKSRRPGRWYFIGLAALSVLVVGVALVGGISVL